MYTVEGGRHLPERELDHLAGYAGSRPVRIGNGAVEQRQTDVLGEVMGALAMARNAGLARPATAGACSARWSTSCEELAASPTTACGRSAVRCGTSPTAG